MKNTILLYYKYTPVADPQKLRDEQYDFCKEYGLKGRIIVAHEGINGTLEGTPEACDAYRAYMVAQEQFADIHWKISEGTPDQSAFPKLSVKVRTEIVSLHLGENDFSPTDTTGVHLKPEDLRTWYEEGKEFHIVDMRNDYELEVGKFKDTVFPGMSNFRDLRKDIQKIKNLKDKPVLTVCTGGVRCEKASGFLVKEGFTDVYQLDGGIVSYMEKYPGKDFEGSLYVFDTRKTVHLEKPENHKIIANCRKCKKPTESYVNCANFFCNEHFVCCHDCTVQTKIGKNGTKFAYCGPWCKIKDTLHIRR